MIIQYMNIQGFYSKICRRQNSPHIFAGMRTVNMKKL